MAPTSNCESGFVKGFELPPFFVFFPSAGLFPAAEVRRWLGANPMD
jgi:hypothetical protein